MRYLPILLLSIFCCFESVQAQSNNQKWVISTARATELYAQSWATRSKFPEDFINTQWKDGKFITSISYGAGVWNVVLSKGNNYKKQTWATRLEFPTDLIKQRWEEGYSLTNMAYGQSAWACVFTNNTDIGKQTYKLSSTFPADFVESKWEEGYYVSSVVYGAGRWAVIMSTGKVQPQSYIKSRSFPESWIKEKLNADYDISNIAFGDGYWVVIAAQDSQFDGTIYSNQQYPKNEIAKAWSQDKAITAVSYGYLPGENKAIKNANELAITVSNKVGTNDSGKPNLILLSVMDTKDRLLGLGARHALQAVNDQFSAAAESSGLHFQPLLIQESNFSRNKLQSTISSLKIGPEDVLVFYYFGHGFRFPNNTSRYPNCFVGRNGVDHPNEAALPLTDIYQSLMAKNARLTLVFAECCNNEIGVPAPVDSYVSVRPMSVNHASKDRYKSLFLKQSGSILLASSDEGQASWATTTGGYFLDSFMDAFQYHVNVNNKVAPSWNVLLEDTKNRVSKLARSKNRTQDPIFSIQLK